MSLYVGTCGRYGPIFMCVQEVQLFVHVYVESRSCFPGVISLESLTGLKVTHRLSRLA